MAIINASHDIRSKNLALLANFSQYCAENPDQRFWQALRNWAGVNFLMAQDHLDDGVALDTYYWEGKNG